MTGQVRSISVVYLAWLPYGISHFKDFIESYLQFNAGYDHELVICFNGTGTFHPDKSGSYIEYLNERSIIPAKIIYIENGQDIYAYQQVAKQLDSAFFLFLNTYSRILADNWLKNYVSNWDVSCGIIGATGSYANYMTATRVKVMAYIKGNGSILSKSNMVKYFIKIALLYGTNFKKYPAPHIRTNAFFIAREIFLKIDCKELNSKMRAYFFENGKKSMTEQLRSWGLKCLVVDRYGKTYDTPYWPDSRVFWDARQENLLVSDNQTRVYDIADEEEKKLYRKMAWNK